MGLRLPWGVGRAKTIKEAKPLQLGFKPVAQIKAPVLLR
jgi:hypothetical protein